jgi:hypothetical protein
MRWVEDIGPPAGDDVYDLFNRKSHHPFLLWIGELFDIKTKEMRETGVIAAMYGTFVKAEAAAKEFWHQVARGGIEYEDTAPSTVLDRWLKVYAETKASERIKVGMIRNSGVFYSGCIYAWNAHRRGKTIKDIISDTKKGLPAVAD